MIARLFGKMSLLGGILLLSMLVVGPLAYAKPPGGHLNVTEVLVDDPDNPTSITITGEDFDFGPGPLVVTLGEFGSLSILSATGTEIVATLPANIPDGDFLLTVSTGNGQSQNDEYDLTIGAVGPQGEKGDTGAKGDKGDTGAKGDKGNTGATGAKGDKGDTGATGAKGDKGNPGSGGRVIATIPGAGSVLCIGEFCLVAVTQCPGVKVVSGGGCQPSFACGLAVQADFPATTSSWICSIQAPCLVRAHAICVNP